jgi:MFS family permease
LVWTLATAVGYTLIGRLSDIFGRRWFIIGTSILGLVGNIIAATAQSVNTLIAANVFNGLAASGQLSFPVIIGELVPNRARGPYNVVVLLSSTPFAVFGPVIARAFIQHTERGWRWSYYLGIILSGISAILYILFYWPPTYALLHVNGKTKLQQAKTLDFMGVFLYTTGLVLFLIGVSWGGSTYPWKSSHVIGTIVAGASTLIVLGFWGEIFSYISIRGLTSDHIAEAYSGLDYPLIPMRLFKNIPWVAITVCATVGSMIYYSMSVLWPLVVGALYTKDVVQIGWMSVSS